MKKKKERHRCVGDLKPIPPFCYASTYYDNTANIIPYLISWQALFCVLHYFFGLLQSRLMAEYSPLGRDYVLEYSNSDRDYPVIGVKKDPRASNYKIPNDLAAHPDSAKYPNHKFTGTRQSGSDERVIWVYEILPGPWVPFTRYDDNLGPVQGRRRYVANSSQVPSLTSTTKRTYEGREGSAIVSWEIEETWSDGTGSSGNPAYPINDRDLYDDRLGPVQERRQIVVRTGTEQGSLTRSGSTITRITYEPFNEFLLVRVTQTYSVPGPQLDGQEYDEVLNIPIPYNEIVQGDDYTADPTEIVRPLNDVSAIVTNQDVPSVVDAIKAISYQAETYSSIRLPDVLVSFNVYWEENQTDSANVSEEDFSPTLGGNRTEQVLNASASATIRPVYAYEIKRGYSGPALSTEYIFFTDDIDNLDTSTYGPPWPTWIEGGGLIVLQGQGQSVRKAQRIRRSEVYQWTSPVVSTATFQLDDTTNTDISYHPFQLPYCLHGAINVTEPDTLTVTATATPTISGFSALEAEAEVNGVVVAGSIAATDVTSVDPDTYVLSVSYSPYKFGLFKVSVVTVDITPYV